MELLILIGICAIIVIIIHVFFVSSEEEIEKNRQRYISDQIRKYKECPKCRSRDCRYSERYDYSVTGKDLTVYYTCKKCQHEWSAWLGKVQ